MGELVSNFARVCRNKRDVVLLFCFLIGAAANIRKKTSNKHLRDNLTQSMLQKKGVFLPKLVRNGLGI